MPIWALFYAVITAVIAAVVAMGDAAKRYGTHLSLGFVLFAVAHGVTIVRHYAPFERIRDILAECSDEACQEAKAVVQALSPIDKFYMLTLYGIAVVLVLLTIYIVRQSHRPQRDLDTPLGMTPSQPAKD